MRQTVQGTGTVRRHRSRTSGTAISGISGRTSARITAAALLAAGALCATALQAPAAGAAEPPGAAASAPASADAKQDAKKAAAFWTAKRMRAAKPLDLLSVARKKLDAAAARAASAPAAHALPRGKEAAVPPTLPSLPSLPSPGLKAFPQAGGPWTGGGKVTATAGRVFFTYQNRQASCSGNAVTSDNRSTVLTAGHCVKLDGAWHTNWIFVPGYHDGQAPHGKWAASKTLATPQWTKSEDINYDVGAAVVPPLNGKHLTDAVGSQGVAFNTGYTQKMYAFGYPAASPYDGSKLIYCSGTTIKDPLFSKDHGMPCNMTGGSSGGPWFTKFDEKTGTGLQSSVNSFGYTFLPNTMFGPYFGEDAKNLYNKAQSS